MTEEELRRIEELMKRRVFVPRYEYTEAVASLIAEVRTLQKHIDGDECGFDRTASHCENTYVCRCGYRGQA